MGLGASLAVSTATLPKVAGASYNDRGLRGSGVAEDALTPEKSSWSKK